MTEEQAKEEYEKSEKSMRYQLIEGRLITEHNLQVQFEELKSFAMQMIKGQMAQFGQMNPSEKELEDIAARILSNQDEVKLAVKSPGPLSVDELKLKLFCMVVRSSSWC